MSSGEVAVLVEYTEIGPVFKISGEVTPQDKEWVDDFVRKARENWQKTGDTTVRNQAKSRSFPRCPPEGKNMGKTEREYFSRVVKKKLLALADPDLHRLAQKALR